ncbi:hypothetical protein [Marixanthomonas spongiae]|nr:hypothetical protein [Marixanthomonas spongiae]
MKNFLMLTMIIILTSCGLGDKEKQEAKQEDRIEQSDEKTTLPIAKESWRGWKPPKQVNGYTLTYYETDPFSSKNLYSASLRYEKGGVKVPITIVDGSTGKGTAEIRQHREFAEKELNHESSFGYEKTVDYNGTNAREEYLNATKQYLIRFLYKNRYGVSVKSKAPSSEELWELIEGLQSNELEK